MFLSSFLCKLQLAELRPWVNASALKSPVPARLRPRLWPADFFSTDENFTLDFSCNHSCLEVLDCAFSFKHEVSVIVLNSHFSS